MPKTIAVLSMSLFFMLVITGMIYLCVKKPFQNFQKLPNQSTNQKLTNMKPSSAHKANLDNLKIKKMEKRPGDISSDKYVLKSLDNDVMEIGTERHSPPKPYLKLSKWDGEASFRIDVPINTSDNPEEKGERLVYKGDGKSVEFYAKYPEEITEKDSLGKEHTFVINEEGGIEFDTVLYEKPENNIISYPIQTKDLEFYYQPPLNEEIKNPDLTCSETECKDKIGMVRNFRPTHVVGSYAVYHKNKTGDFSQMGGKNYKTGKAFHIYRPRVWDVNGNETWGELSIDEKNQTLNVSVSKGFLDSAAYPVTIDPTFGYDQIGSTEYLGNSKYSCSLFSGAPGTLNKMSVYMIVTGGMGDIPRTTAVYNHSDLGLVARSQIRSWEGILSQAWWANFNFSTEQITNSEYLLCYVIESGSFGMAPSQYYDTGTLDQGHIATYSGAEDLLVLDNTLPAVTHNNYKFSIYATYTPPPATQITGINMQGVCVGNESCVQWAPVEPVCNELDGWAWYTTNGRGACWSKTLADAVSWNKVGANDTDNPGTYTCATGTPSLKDRMIAAAAGEWYKIVSNVNGVTIDSSKNGSAGYPSISALAVSDCIDGTRDLCTGDGCLGADLPAINTNLQTWAGTTGRHSALPFCSEYTCSQSTTNDYFNACTQTPNEDKPLSCSLTDIFYKNQKVCDDGDTNRTWASSAATLTNGTVLGYYSCSEVDASGSSNAGNYNGFRVVVRP